jgi:6-phosphofructokinase 1
MLGLARHLRGGGEGAATPGEDQAKEVTIKFLKRNVSELQSYLSYLQEYQNPMVARAWPANTNFVSVSETVTDTVFRNSLRAESKGLVYREWVRAGPRKQTLFTPSEVNAAIVACGGLDPGINVVVRDICSTLDFAYNVRRAWGVRYGWRGFTDRAAQVPSPH